VFRRSTNEVVDLRLVLPSTAGSDDNIRTMQRRGDYGYDAPAVLAIFAAIGAGSTIAAIVSARAGGGRLTLLTAFYGAFFLTHALSFLYTTRRGKFQAWEKILDELRLRGDERVLDMGCGRGAVLTAVAHRLRNGRVVGVDLWSTRDQSGNSPDAPRRNAALEGVAERIDVETGDMRALSFPAGSFDLVVSSLAIHNIHSPGGRAQAIAEGWRVLKPGGRLAIADIRATAHYAAVLRRLGAAEVARRGLGWRFWYGNPFARTVLVTASKPEGL
jgi:arsenite methyltransferase